MAYFVSKVPQVQISQSLTFRMSLLPTYFDARKHLTAVGLRQ